MISETTNPTERSPPRPPAKKEERDAKDEPVAFAKNAYNDQDEAMHLEELDGYPEAYLNSSNTKKNQKGKQISID